MVLVAAVHIVPDGMAHHVVLPTCGCSCNSMRLEARFRCFGTAQEPSGRGDFGSKLIHT